MYNAFFQLKQAPFSIAPDPNYLFMSERHREALAHLLYGVSSGGGFVLLTGEIGAGKTTVCRCFLEQVPERCKVAYIFNPKLSVEELLHTICDEFGIAVENSHSIKDHVDALNAYLLATHAQGQNNVLIIDEAQNLAPPVLEQLRLLTNLETRERKLLQIILIGQPELRTMLAKPELEQLAQRVIARYHLGPLSASETGRYIAHRLGVAGLPHSTLFGKRLLPLIQRLTGGVPRRINLLCDRALLGAYARSKQVVERKVIIQAAREVFGEQDPRQSARPWLWPGVIALLCLTLLGYWWHGQARNVLWAKGSAAAVVGSAPSAASKELRAASSASAAGNTGTSGLSTASGTPVASGMPVVSRMPVASGMQVAPASILATASATGVATPDKQGTSDEANSGAVQRGEQANAAFAALARLWGKTLAGPDPCQNAPKKNLRCFSGTGGWDEIRELRRPALLALNDAKRGPYYALLLGLDANSARLQIDGEIRTVALADLKPQFNGEFTTLWSMPRRFRDEVLHGDRGSDVDWIASQLASLNHSAKPRENAAFEQELDKQVRQFQSARKLKVDGLVGPKTYMHLNQATGVNEPRLQDNLATATQTDGKADRK